MRNRMHVAVESEWHVYRQKLPGRAYQPVLGKNNALPYESAKVSQRFQLRLPLILGRLGKSAWREREGRLSNPLIRS